MVNLMKIFLHSLHSKPLALLLLLYALTFIDDDNRTIVVSTGNKFFALCPRGGRKSARLAAALAAANSETGPDTEPDATPQPADQWSRVVGGGTRQPLQRPIGATTSIAAGGAGVAAPAPVLRQRRSSADAGQRRALFGSASSGSGSSGTSGGSAGSGGNNNGRYHGLRRASAGVHETSAAAAKAAVHAHAMRRQTAAALATLLGNGQISPPLINGGVAPGRKLPSPALFDSPTNTIVVAAPASLFDSPPLPTHGIPVSPPRASSGTVTRRKAPSMVAGPPPPLPSTRPPPLPNFPLPNVPPPMPIISSMPPPPPPPSQPPSATTSTISAVAPPTPNMPPPNVPTIVAGGIPPPRPPSTPPPPLVGPNPHIPPPRPPSTPPPPLSNPSSHNHQHHHQPRPPGVPHPSSHSNSTIPSSRVPAMPTSTMPPMPLNPVAAAAALTVPSSLHTTFPSPSGEAAATLYQPPVVQVNHFTLAAVERRGGLLTSRSSTIHVPGAPIGDPSSAAAMMVQARHNYTAATATGGGGAVGGNGNERGRLGALRDQRVAAVAAAMASALDEMERDEIKTGGGLTSNNAIAMNTNTTNGGDDTNNTSPTNGGGGMIDDDIETRGPRLTAWGSMARVLRTRPRSMEIFMGPDGLTGKPTFT
jgi:hypothetical protein